MDLEIPQVQKTEAAPLSPFLQTLYLRRREVMIGVSSALAGVLILIVYFQSGPNARAFASAEIAYEKWADSPQDEQLYNAMREAIHKIPALERKYEAPIAQKLLFGEDNSEALRMAMHSLSRIKEDTPFHAAFAFGTLLIEQASYTEALEKALQLKEEMNKTFDVQELASGRLVGGSLLYAYNLLRIACLHEQLNNRAEEKMAWEEFERLIQEKSPVSDLVLGSFSEKMINLHSYIAERKKGL